MITLQVNGEVQDAAPDGRTSLADMLREELLLTGTHLGCEHGVCGACTVMLDGAPARACLTLAASCTGADVRTVEGFEDDALMQALRAAFSRHHALQCGYCTPGMLVTAYDIVRRLPQADEARIRLELAGNLCRCTGYQGIVEAIADVLGNPPVAAVQPAARLRAEPVTVATVGLAAHHADTALVDVPAVEMAGTTLARIVPIAATSSDVWPLLRNVEGVARLLPGAAVKTQDGDQVTGTFTAALGPIRATFAGRAHVAFDDAARTALIRGSGGDRLTRSGAEGVLRLALHLAEPGCTVELQMTYRLKGPLAQFGRPAVVEALVDGLLTRFAANLAAAASGHAPERQRGGLVAMVADLLRRLLRRG